MNERDGSNDQLGETDVLPDSQHVEVEGSERSLIERIRAKIRALQPGGPEVDWALLVDFIDGVLDAEQVSYVKRNINTYRAWSETHQTILEDEAWEREQKLDELI